MRRSTILAVAFSFFTLAAAAEDRHQSYISHDDGGTLVKQSDDGRELEARVNLPVYPGDEIVTNRRGRTEIRLADGNVIALDRTTAVRFSSIYDSYEGEASQTVADLRYGKVMVFRSDIAEEALRLDSDSASYVASVESVFAVETDDRGRDRVTVFEGQVEVRTPARRTRMRAGETANVDERGAYALASDVRGADAFERWFLSRVERYDGSDSRYLDSRFSYYDEELRSHGNWVYISHYGWAWRPVVSVGWRPYYNGYWHRGIGGTLTWVSYEPWGWLPYHYGRWAYDTGYGWFWVPGTGYAPAWVYWMYGPSYVGWAPAGWYDCYGPYYGWAGRPYVGVTASFGFGFYGRIRVSEIDLRPWTFVDPNGLYSNRVDRAAITTDAIRSRLGRGTTGGFATVSNSPARFTREQFRDPADAINRISRTGVLGSGSGPGAAPAVADMTPFFRRDEKLDANIRERIVRQNPSDGRATTLPAPATVWSGSSGGGVAPIGRGDVAPIGRDGVAPIGPTRSGATREGGSASDTTGSTEGRIRRGDAPGSSTGSDRPSTGTGTIDRGGDGAVVMPGRTRGVDRDGAGSDTGTTNRGESSDTWRGRVERGSRSGSTGSGSTEAPRATPRTDDSWRGRATGRTGSRNSGSSESTRSEGSRDVPRRVIDGIGGARVTSGERSSGSTSSGRNRGWSNGNSGSSGRAGGSSSGSSSGSMRSGGSSGGGSSSGSSGGSSGGRSSSGSSSSGSSSSSGGGSRSEGGKIGRD